MPSEWWKTILRVLFLTTYSQMPRSGCAAIKAARGLPAPPQRYHFSKREAGRQELLECTIEPRILWDAFLATSGLCKRWLGDAVQWRQWFDVDAKPSHSP